MYSLPRKILLLNQLKKVFLFIVIDIAIISISLYISFLLRFEFDIPPKYVNRLMFAFPVFIAIKIPLFAVFRLYRITWRFVGINDLSNVFNALIVSEAAVMALVLVPMPSYQTYFTLFEIDGFPRSVFMIDAIVSFLLLSGVRMSKRVYLEVFLKRRHAKRGKQTIIAGAGDTGEMILRDIIKQGFSEFFPLIFLDDDPLKQATYVHGVKVEGRLDDLREAVSKYQANALIIAIPNLNHKALKRIYDLARESGISTIKIVPRIYIERKPNINIKNLEDISVEDLIGRQTVSVDYDAIESFLKDKTVLITGAGGSIGSELVMQVCSCEPKRMVLLDVDETDLYNLELKLRTLAPDCVHATSATDGASFIVGDVRDRDLLDRVFQNAMPDVVFHAAAYKHVPIIEHNAAEAVKVNIFGTRNLAEAAARYKVRKFIMISTDKAVRPTSIMGGTKRIAEYICRAYNQTNGTEFVSVRFGNVLGSRGSVLPTFMEQLRHGGPVTVTHRDMQRYFMTIQEAVTLVLQASILGKGGEVMVLDMGEPVKIVDLAKELMKIHGIEPDRDIDIVFTGIRPGEKLFEELLTAEEGTTATKHEKIYTARESMVHSMQSVSGMLEDFERVLRQSSLDGNQEVRRTLQKYIKYYQQA